PEGELVARTSAHASAVSGIHWCGEEEIASACYGRVSFWDPASGDLRERLDWKGSLIALAVSPDGAVVACGSQDRNVHFWRRRSGEDSMMTMTGYLYKPAAIAFDPGARLLATSGAEYATVWNFSGAGPEGSSPELLEGHSEPITDLCFAHARRRLATGAADGLVLIWDLDAEGRGRLVGGAPATAPVERLTGRGDDKALAAIDTAGGVTVWHSAGAASAARLGDETS
ncbi:WD40 repeat domain-containing protein, partial [Thiocapsa sp.]|uniref:WD40 repeat domain-containing protein n=1 Tax=Thiocapsa sp. TaxID=2024551 RepID=UPI003592F91B